MERKSIFSALWFVPMALAVAKLGIHLYTNIFAGYGFFRDELYYLVSTEHLDFGYVDHPPLSIWILAVNRLIFGDSLFAARILPALFGAGTVFITGMLATEMGGKRLAQFLASTAALVSNIFLAFGSVYSMNAFDIFLASCVFFALVRILHDPTPQRWLMLGVLLGLGLFNKTSFLWLGTGIAVGMLATPYRTSIFSKPVLQAVAIAFAFFLPYVLWNAVNDWAHLEFIGNATADKYSGLSIVDFVLGQGLINNPATLPLFLVGAVALFVVNGGKYRLIGWTVTTAFIILALNGHSKPEYFAAMTPALFAAGAVAFESLKNPVLRFFTRVVYAPLLTAGILLAPAVVPILSVDRYIAFAESIGLTPHTSESKRISDLPQFYADMHGWDDLAKAVRIAYLTLDESEQKNALIYGQNYGEVSAVNFLGKSYNLPRAASGHNSYFLWGPGNTTPDAVIIIGGSEEDHRSVFDQVNLVQHFSSPHIMPYEDRLPIFIARKRKMPLDEIWQKVKHYE